MEKNAAGSASQAPENPQEAPETLLISVGARALVEYACRTGGLHGLVFHGLSGAEGTRLHRAFYKELSQHFPDRESEVEVAVDREYKLPGVTLQVRGRMDALLLPPGLVETDLYGKTTKLEAPAKPGEKKRSYETALGLAEVIEAKSYAGSAKLIPLQGDPLHWAQALLYACLLHHPQKEGTRVFTCHLAYLSQEGHPPVFLTKQYTEAEAWAQEQSWIGAYADWAHNEEVYRQARDASIRELGFPFPLLRPGQKQLMQETLAAFQTQVPLLVQAPTGTGKTISTLFPAIKALGLGWGRQIFYLTAKVATRQVARQAAQNLRERGLLLRTITLRAKEQMCLCPELYCDTKLCPYATAYYEHVPQALAELLEKTVFEAADLMDCAERHQVCPFELSLDLARYCDLVIGDYNHFFDPRIRLQRFFGEEGDRKLLLIDEAHNLPDRSREMYTASLSFTTLHAARKAIELYSPSLAQKLGVVVDYFSRLAKSLKTGEPGFDQVEKAVKPEQVFRADQFRATRCVLPGLRRFLGGLVYPLRELLDALEDREAKRPIMDFFFEMLFFLRVQEEFWNESYLACFHRHQKDVLLELRCLDTANRLVEAYREKHSPVFFSATLTPMEYYRDCFCGQSDLDRPEELRLPSPFPRENLLLLHYNHLRTTYEARKHSMREAAEAILASTQARIGNYLAFFPSYRYLKAVSSELAGLLAEGGQSLLPVDLLEQKSGMSQEASEAFLEAFAEPAKDRSTLGLAVLGGSFGEGIDLVGERLNGVIIIGVGLPQISPERDLLRQYYDEKLRLGFAFAYLYPGFTKVLQAAGRLIRTETDRGFILLCDERYDKPMYRQLLPEEWRPIAVEEPEDVLPPIREFFES